MKQLLIALLGCTVFLTGCGEDKLTPEQELAKQRLEYEHIQKMAEIKALEKQNLIAQEYVTQETQQAQEFSATTPTYQEQDNDLALGLLGGAVAGYMASELLDDGWSRGYDSYGRETYYDKDRRPVSRSSYLSHSKTRTVTKSMPKETLKTKLTKFKEKSKAVTKKGIEKAKPALAKGKELTKKGIEKAKPIAKKTLDKSKALAKKGVEKSKPLVSKAKVKTTEMYKKAKPVLAKKAKDTKKKSALLYKKTKSKTGSFLKKTKKRK